VHPVLRAYDVPASLAFFVDYLGFILDWQDGETPGPVYLQLSRGPLRLHVSTHHGDETPGTVLVIEVTGVKEWIEELHRKRYLFSIPDSRKVLARTWNRVQISCPGQHPVRRGTEDHAVLVPHLVHRQDLGRGAGLPGDAADRLGLQQLDTLGLR
jgi:catechol 2,3-dioxygenase-like lactoylglutathione lyase family enzyme